jgi:dihydrofolate reductase
VERLYPDLEELRYTEPLKEAIKTTGAVVMGRRSFEMGDPDSYADNYEFQVPIFVLTSHIAQKQPGQTERLTFTFVSDGIENAIAQARKAANDKGVMIIGGANLVQQCLRAAFIDEIDIDILPILLSNGLRLFENLGEQPSSWKKSQCLMRLLEHSSDSMLSKDSKEK